MRLPPNLNQSEDDRAEVPIDPGPSELLIQPAHEDRPSGRDRIMLARHRHPSLEEMHDHLRRREHEGISPPVQRDRKRRREATPERFGAGGLGHLPPQVPNPSSRHAQTMLPPTTLK